MRRFLKNMMRPAIAYVVNSLNPGGTEKLVLEMSVFFSREFDVSVLCLDESGVWAKDIRDAGIPAYCLWRQQGFDASLPFKLAFYFQKHKIQVVHAHQCTPWFYSALSRLIYPKPRLILEEHGRLFPEKRSLKRVLINKLLIRPLTHRFIAVSENVRKRLQIYEGLKSDQIEVVYNGINPKCAIKDEEKIRIRREFKIAHDEIVVGTVCRFDKIKNLPLLINALAKAKKEFSRLRGLLIGDGPVFKEILTLIERLNLKEDIIMPGYRNDAEELIQCMDLYVNSSMSEGISIALLEAIAQGIPVIVTDVGGNTEVVVKDHTGWVIPSDYVDSLGQAIIEAVKDKGKRQKLAEAGKVRFKEQFTFQRMIEKYKEIYTQMINSV